MTVFFFMSSISSRWWCGKQTGESSHPSPSYLPFQNSSADVLWKQKLTARLCESPASALGYCKKHSSLGEVNVKHLLKSQTGKDTYVRGPSRCPLQPNDFHFQTQNIIKLTVILLKSPLRENHFQQGAIGEWDHLGTKSKPLCHLQGDKVAQVLAKSMQNWELMAVSRFQKW